MTAPMPLTATPPAHILWSEEGEPVAQEFDDVYFSKDGGLAETKSVFLQGCGLPGLWQEKQDTTQDKDVFVVAELGFGSGLNFLVTWELWTKTSRPEQRLHYLSVEAFPFSKEQLIKALASFPTLKPFADQLISAWPERVRGVHRLDFENVILTLYHSDVEQALSGMNAPVNAWFLDGFSPAKNADMWSSSVFSHMARLSMSGTRTATFTVAGHVRRGLARVGFEVAKKPGFGRKRERLEAIYSPKYSPEYSPAETCIATVAKAPPRRADTPVIIGGGIAGASIAHAFSLRGIIPILIDPHIDLSTGASGNPAGLVMPKLDLQDRPESRFYNAAFLFACALYQMYGTILGTGVVQMATSKMEADRFAKIARYQALPKELMRSVTQSEAEAMLEHKINTKHGGLYFPTALRISPKLSAQNLRKSCTHIAKIVGRINSDSGTHQILDNEGKILAQTNALFVCNGANILDLHPADVRFTRGQICWGPNDKITKALIAGNYAAPYKNGVLLGATHDHVSAGENTKTNPDDTAQILSGYAKTTEQNIDPQGWASRAAVRVTTRNTLPISTQIDAGLFILTGLGSRGLMTAPLLGEDLVCRALGEPSPLDGPTQERFFVPLKA